MGRDRDKIINRLISDCNQCYKKKQQTHMTKSLWGIEISLNRYEGRTLKINHFNSESYNSVKHVTRGSDNSGKRNKTIWIKLGWLKQENAC